jgi:hypothetical protein
MRVSDESQLREKLRKIEALFAGAGTPGERSAAEAARERVRRRLAALEPSDPPIEMQFSLRDQWPRRLFLALCRRYGLKPFRRYRQHRTTVMLRAPAGFVNLVLWPEFQQLNAALKHYLDEITDRIIRDEVHRDTSEAPETTASLRQAG